MWFLKTERKLPGLRTLKESANRPGIERNAALPEFCGDRRPRRPFFSQPPNLVQIWPEQALERLRMGRWLHGKRVMPTGTRRRNGHREAETERSHAKRAIRSVQRCRSSRCGETDIPNGTRLHPIAPPSRRSASTSLQGRLRTGYGRVGSRGVVG